MLTRGHGDLLTADVDALVNPVNTVGVMGKGLALRFKRAFPENFTAYEEACGSGELTIGTVHVHRLTTAGAPAPRPRLIVNFPTKRHWRSRSRPEDVRSGLAALRSAVAEWDIRSLALPALGCGHGGLSWTEVEPLIAEALADLTDVEARVWKPAEPGS